MPLPTSPIDITRIKAQLFWAKVQKTPTCWLWQGGRNKQGYGQYGMPSHLAHRIAYTLTYGAIPHGLLVLHRCNTPQCVNPEHLYVGTMEDNVKDTLQAGHHGWVLHPGKAARGEHNGTKTHPERVARGERHWSAKHPTLVRRGESHHKAKLTEDDVQAIRQRYQHDGPRVLAQEYGVSRQTVWAIIQRKIWKHMPGQAEQDAYQRMLRGEL